MCVSSVMTEETICESHENTMYARGKQNHVGLFVSVLVDRAYISSCSFTNWGKGFELFYLLLNIKIFINIYFLSSY